MRCRLGDGALNLRLIDDKDKGCIIKGAEERPVASADAVLSLLSEGQQRRTTAATCMNARSSRSHTLLMTQVESRSKTAKAGKAAGEFLRMVCDVLLPVLKARLFIFFEKAQEFVTRS